MLLLSTSSSFLDLEMIRSEKLSNYYHSRMTHQLPLPDITISQKVYQQSDHLPGHRRGAEFDVLLGVGQEVEREAEI